MRFSAMKRTKWPTVVVAAALLLSTSMATSEASAFVGTVDVRVRSSSADIDWTPVGEADSYMLVDERTATVLWRGSGTSFTLALPAASSRSVLVVAVVGGEPKLLAKVLAVAPRLGSSLPSVVAASTAHQTEVVATSTVRLLEPDDAAMDGGQARDAGNQFVLDHALDDPLETIELGAFLAVDGVPTAAVTGLDLSPATLPVENITEDLGEGTVVPMVIYPIVKSTLPYETYIPLDYVDAPDAALIPFDCEAGDGSDYVFGGDHRTGPEYESGFYRTRASVLYSWSERATRTYKTVSPTTRYKRLDDGRYEYESMRQAGDEGIVFVPVANSGTAALTQVQHSVGNPYCSFLNNIDYDVRQEVYQNGGHSIYGAHDRMPNHQLYRTDELSNGTLSTSLVFNHELTSPVCLNPISNCQRWEYQYVR